jgi:hypothetical protein
MNLKSGQIEKFEEYSQFASIKEFNHHMEMWMVEHKREFSKGELMGLKRLVRFAAKIPGVANAKIGTVLRAIHEEYHENGISRSTFKRMVQKAIKMGILNVYETERKNGSQSSNLYVFNRFPSNEPPKHETLNHPNKTSILFKTENKKINKRNKAPKDLDHTFVSNRVPQPFVQLIKCFFPEAKTIEEYWYMVKIAAFGFDLSPDSEAILHISIDTFKQLIRKLKSTNQIKKPIAFFYGILKNKLFQFYSETLSEKETETETRELRYELEYGEILYYDWLNPCLSTAGNLDK